MSVMQSCFIIVSGIKMKKILNSFLRFIAIWSGLVHDVGHFGFKNSYEIARNSEISRLYRNQSVTFLFILAFGKLSCFLIV